MGYDGGMTFRVVSHARLYGGWWIVVRSDGRMMASMQTPNAALYWVRTWGDTIGQEKKGTVASHRLLRAIGMEPTEPEPMPVFNDDF